MKRKSAMVSLCLSVFVTSTYAQKISIGDVFEKCVDKTPSECGLFRNKEIGRRVAKLMGQNKFISVSKSLQSESTIDRSCNYEHWIEKSQCYIEAMLWGRNIYGATRLIILYNTETKKIDIYWKQGREWSMGREDEFYPDKLIFFSKKFENQ